MGLMTKIIPPNRWVEVRAHTKRPPKYEIRFYQFRLSESTPDCLGSGITDDGSIVKLGKIISSFIRDGLIPVEVQRDKDKI